MHKTPTLETVGSNPIGQAKKKSRNGGFFIIDQSVYIREFQNGVTNEQFIYFCG